MLHLQESAATTFVGRTHELLLLDEALARARDGRGQVLLLAGEPGIGKTRLADEFARRARDADVEVLIGRCFEGPGAPAFWPWTQLIRAYARGRDADTLAAELGTGAADVAAVLPDLHAWLPGLGAPGHVSDERARPRFFEAVTHALMAAATSRPLLLVLEDLQGADRASLLLLGFLARAIGRTRMLVVGTCRDEALAPGQALAEMHEELAREQLSIRIGLSGLDLADVAELVHRVTGAAAPDDVAALIHRRTEGNPLYVSEVAQALVTTRRGPVTDVTAVAIPATVRSAIASRLGILSPAAYEAMIAAATFGRTFRVDVLSRAAGRSVATLRADLDQAMAARIVAAAPDDPGCYRFAHALFAETLLAGVGEGRRIALHRAAAEALAADTRSELDVPEIAYHYFAAGPGGNAAESVRWAERAADRALAMMAYEEAAEWYRRALVALGWQGDDVPLRRTELLLGLGEATKRTGSIADARPAFEQAARIGRTLGSAEIVTRAALGFAPAIAWGENAWPDPAVIGTLEEAIASWQGRAASLHARALVHLGMAMMFGDQARRAYVVAAGVAMARALDDPTALRYALAAFLASYQSRFEVERRLALTDELIALAVPARDLEPLAVARLWRCIHLIECGDVSGSGAELTRLEALEAELRQPAWRWHVRMPRIVHAILRGDLTEASREITCAYEIGIGIVGYAAEGYRSGQEFMLSVLRGAPDDAIYREVFAAHPDPVAMSPLAWSAADRGDVAEARAWVERFAPDEFAIIRQDLMPPVACMFLAEACALLGDAAHAEQLIGIVAPQARQWIVWAEGLPLGPAAHPLGLLLRTVGRLDEAARHFEFAIAESRRVDAPPFLARGLYEYGRLLRDRGGDDDAARAAPLLAECRAIAAAIGMQGLVRKVDAAVGTGHVRSETSSDVRFASVQDGPSAGDSTVFRRDGESWVVAYEGTTIRLHRTRGLDYLAKLLHDPGREFHATDLIGASADAPATAAASERARLTVTKGIGNALARIGKAHPVLGAHLRATVRRGYLCVYIPDPRHPIVWDH